MKPLATGKIAAGIACEIERIERADLRAVEADAEERRRAAREEQSYLEGALRSEANRSTEPARARVAVDPGEAFQFEAAVRRGEAVEVRADPIELPPTSPPPVENALGLPIIPPVLDSEALLLRVQLADPTERSLRTHAGAHVAVRRPWRPVPYWHHGIYLGDGTVIHFCGEPGGGKDERPSRQSDARVVRSSVRCFLGEQSLEDLRVVRVRRADGTSCASLDPSLTVMRAFEALGEDGYQLALNNCEHFAFYCQMGMRMSLQVDRVQSSISSRGFAKRAVGRALGKRLVAMREPAPRGFLMDPLRPREGEVAYPIDLGRAVWCSSRSQLVVEQPLWDGHGTPILGIRRPWTIGSMHVDSLWHPQMPSMSVEPGWHAALIYLPERRETFWIDNLGRWFAAGLPMRELTDRRLEHASRLVEVLTSTPSRLLQAAYDGVENVRDR